MRIGTWNLEECPEPDAPRGRAIAAWLDEQAVDVWLLTEEVAVIHRPTADGRQLSDHAAYTAQIDWE